jgi:hypothetical protein
MVHVRTHRLLLWILAATLLVAACVPDPTNRPSPSLIVAPAIPTPVPTPAGPTPTPSFLRPTPTPQPTFFVYTVHSGDSLAAIAKRYGTTALSIAYWNRLAYPTLDPDSAGYRPNFIGVGWMLRLIPNGVVDPENLPPGAATPEPLVSDEPTDPSPLPEGG